jgi:hypothetical protein
LHRPGTGHIRTQRAAQAAIRLLAAALCMIPLAAFGETVETLLEQSLAGVAQEQDPRVIESLGRIDGTGRQLLALRSYLRSREHLSERWSWTDEQIAAWKESPEHADLAVEIERVKSVFVRENPGYELWVNPQVRSLDAQIAGWNANESVTAASQEVLARAIDYIGAAPYRAAPPERRTADFARFLVSHVPTPTPTVAAPGLSPHGQMRAIDFQVHRDGRVVAGPKSATIAADWDAAGWSARLDAAVREGSTAFVGPLASPREPWHYTYVPAIVAAQ